MIKQYNESIEIFFKASYGWNLKNIIDTLNENKNKNKTDFSGLDIKKRLTELLVNNFKPEVSEVLVGYLKTRSLSDPNTVLELIVSVAQRVVYQNIDNKQFKFYPQDVPAFFSELNKIYDIKISINNDYFLFKKLTDELNRIFGLPKSNEFSGIKQVILLLEGYLNARPVVTSFQEQRRQEVLRQA